MATIRHRPEDFVVEELTLEEPSGDGPHTWLWIEKRGLDTAACIRLLARWRGLPRREIGYAGRKDRHAVTRQWLSLPALDPQQALSYAGDERLRVLRAVRHASKLRLGQLLGNRFVLVVRDVDAASCDVAGKQLRRLAAEGMANRYGEQRFGRDGANVRRGAEILRQIKLRGERRHAWLMVSALQSAVFNEVLRRRQQDGTWNQLQAGDVAYVHASGEVLAVADPASLAARWSNFELSPSGPIFGTKMKRPSGAVAELEQQVMTEFDLPEPRRLVAPRGLRLFGTRRPLRVRPTAVDWQAGDRQLELRFELPAGTYATVVLDELFPDGVEDASRGSLSPAARNAER